MPSIAAIETEIIEDFGLFEDWMDKYAYLIDIGKALPPLEDRYKDERHRVRGCQARVWLHARLENGRMWYTADSDAFITKGLIGLLIRVLSGQKPEDIVTAELSFIDTIGIRQHLSGNRSNGLSAMIKKMKAHARSYLPAEA